MTLGRQISRNIQVARAVVFLVVMQGFGCGLLAASTGVAGTATTRDSVVISLPPMAFSPTGYHVFAEHRYPNKNNHPEDEEEHDADDVHYVPQAVCHGNHCSKARLPTSIHCTPITKRSKRNTRRNKIAGDQAETSDTTSNVRIPAAVTIRHGRDIVELIEDYYSTCGDSTTNGDQTSYNFSCGKYGAQKDAELLRLLGTHIMRHHSPSSSSTPVHQAGHPGDALRLIGHTVEGLSLSDMRAQRGYLQSGRTINFNSDYTPASPSSSDRAKRPHPSSEGRLDQIFKQRASRGGDEVAEAQYNRDVLERGSMYRPLRGKGGDRHLEDVDAAPSDNDGLPPSFQRRGTHHHTPHLHIPVRDVNSEDDDEAASDGELDVDSDVYLDTTVGWECVLTPPRDLDDHYTYEDAHVLCLGAEQDGAVMTTAPTTGNKKRKLKPLHLRSIFDFIPGIASNGIGKASTFGSSRPSPKDVVAITSTVDASLGAVCTIHYRIVNYGPLAPKIAFGILLLVTIVFGGSMFYMMFPKDPREEAAAKKRKQLKRRYEAEMARDDKLLKERRNTRNGKNNNKNVDWGKRAAKDDYDDGEGGNGFSVDEAMLRQLGIESRDATGIPNYQRSTAAIKSSSARPTLSRLAAQDVVHHRRLPADVSRNPNITGTSAGVGGMSSNREVGDDDTLVASSLYKNPRGLSLGELIGASRSGAGGSANTRVPMPASSSSLGRRLGGPILPLDGTRILQHRDQESPNNHRWEMDSDSEMLFARARGGGMNTHPNDHRSQPHTYLPIPHTPERAGSNPAPTGDTYPIDKW